MASVLNRPYFQDETAAYAKLESLIWPSGPVCPHCGCTDRVRPLSGKAHRVGLKKCYACRKQFRVTVGTVFESSHIPLHIWLQAAHLMCSSKKGISSNQLARILGLTVKSAWFMSHRLREAMQTGVLPPLGGENKVVEADETYVGGKAKNRAYRKAPPKKAAVVSLVERGGEVRSLHVPNVTAATLKPVLEKLASKKSMVMTDDSPIYPSATASFAGHESVNHSANEYVRLGGFVHTNTAEGYFSILKRGIYGTCQHVSEAHLHRYLAEFDFRYNNRIKLGVDDTQRTGNVLRGIVGKRLTYGGSASR